MAKFKIAQNPTFTADVAIPRIGAEPIDVKFTFRVLSRKELAAMYDKWHDTAKAFAVDDEEITFADLAETDIENQVKQVKDIVVGWGFEDEFNDDSIFALCDTSPHAARVIVEAYRKEYAEVRSKN